MPADPTPPIQSPCLSVCMVSGATKHCIGCFRTLPEIARWSRYTDAERAAIMAELPAREARLAAGG
ncbi:MAG TPA: DUF1289 domain-containing protein [Caulobacteraceae bacterium]|nr:DUF1289 domain-containing protein [Caulobacteraceae bacterium]